MTRFLRMKVVGHFVCIAAACCVLNTGAIAQYGGTTGGTTGGATGGTTAGAGTAGANFRNNYHLGFERPEAWGLKYFASTSLLSGLQPPEPPEGHRIGSISLGLELGWLPALDEGQRRIGFNGKALEDLNKAPMMIRPVLRVGLPDKI